MTICTYFRLGTSGRASGRASRATVRAMARAARRARANILNFFYISVHARTFGRRARAGPGGTIHRDRVVPVPDRVVGRARPHYSCPSSSSTGLTCYDNTFYKVLINK
ncbi:hypothetical protein RND81_13G032100 [Saponaria officinalis]|uniref:Uncharacterized protein n=1 Tax=Saponaria officinalis TaxID=3572 RepID=A0AAW1GVI6_SAPOF